MLNSEQFAEAMHAFASLVSMEKMGCVTGTDGQRVCSIAEEPGWPPEVYFNLHHRLLEKIIARYKNLDGVIEASEEGNLLLEFIQQQLIVTDNLIEFQNSMASPVQQINDILSKIRLRGNFTLYPWGTIDHQVYFEIWHTDADEYTVTIFDLGAGREGEPTVRDNYSPIYLVFQSKSEFTEYLNELVTNQNAEPSIALYQRIYGPETNRSTCRACVPERPQTTGNCVVKNLLAAIQQDAIQMHGEESGRDIFRQFYRALLRASLEMADEHASFLDAPLPTLDEICAHIQESQLSFLDTHCDEIMDSIQPLYDALSAKVTKPKPVLDSSSRMYPLGARAMAQRRTPYIPSSSDDDFSSDEASYSNSSEKVVERFYRK